MPTDYGIDEAWGRLTPEQVKAAGKDFVVGYLGEDIAKDLSQAEIAAYHAAGVAVLLVYEYSTTAVHGGASAGTANATLACTQASTKGYPKGCAIAFAVDENTSSNPSIVDAYAKAFTSVCHSRGYRSMEYGGLATVKRCADLNLTDLHWQTYAWSAGAWDARATIRQVQNGITLNGKDVDFDVAMVADYGAWMPGEGDTMKWENDSTKNLVGGRNPETLLIDIWTSIMLGNSAYVPTNKMPLTGAINRIETGVAGIGTVTLTDAQLTTLSSTIAAAVVAHHDALTDTDKPVIEAAVKDALKTGTGS